MCILKLCVARAFILQDVLAAFLLVCLCRDGSATVHESVGRRSVCVSWDAAGVSRLKL